MAALLTVWGCGENGGIAGPVVGDLVVSTATSGSDIDPEGYLLVVVDFETRPIGANEPVTFTGVPTGPYVVELSELAENCAVGGSNPRTVNVPFRDAASTTFEVACVPLVGTLEVSTFTDGEDPDPDGYAVLVDGVIQQAVGVHDGITFRDLARGNHTVELIDVSANCAVTGDNPRTVDIPFGDTVSTTFEVGCVPNVGTLEVVVSTGGEDPDSDGYTVVVDGTIRETAGGTDRITFRDLAQGPHTVELVDVADNCVVTGDNPRTVPIPFGDTISTAFEVACVPNVGTLEVVTSTRGDDLDPDGYTVVVDGTIRETMGANDRITFGDLAAGAHTVRLIDVAVNCAVTGDNPRAVGVPFGETVSTTFQVECEPLGRLEVATSTTGVDLPSGFTVTVAGSPSRALGPNETTVFDNLLAGSYTVTLSGVPSNCQVVNDPNPRSVTVSGGSASTTFHVHCVAVASGSLVFDSNRHGSFDVFVMRDDGSNQMNLTNHPQSDRQAVVSPGGSKIAFTSTRSGSEQVHVMNRDGSGVVRLTFLERAKEPYWSPNGSKIVFSGRMGGQWDIWVMNADGSSPVNLTNHPANDGRPEWSPDGSKVVFDSDRDGARGIHVMNANGSGVTRLTTGNDWNPTWSPDGSKIAFTSFRGGGAEDIWLMSANGSNQVNLTKLPGTLDGEAAFSPDGTTIAFASARAGNAQIYLMDLTGANVRRLTHNTASDRWPSWSP